MCFVVAGFGEPAFSLSHRASKATYRGQGFHLQNACRSRHEQEKTLCTSVWRLKAYIVPRFVAPAMVGAKKEPGP